MDDKLFIKALDGVKEKSQKDNIETTNPENDT